jgi:2-polyprenyl-3-methyl-5-hydroxy-6-metoxy-1,4-benzoquinol methylase
MAADAFTDSDALEAWNEGAEAWDVFVESGADYYRHKVHGPALLAACQPLAGRRILDLGCGQGFFSRELARHGAQVTAIDLSERLLQLARRREDQEGRLGIEYLQLNAADIASHLPPEGFDIVVACMSLQDMADVSGVLRGAFSLVHPTGRMIFSVPHPATDMAFREWERDETGRKLCLKVDRYFETGPALCQWTMARLKYHWSTPYWRYTLGEWTTLVINAGFVIDRLHEPRPTAEQVQASPELEDCGRVPFFLIFDLRKPASLGVA